MWLLWRLFVHLTSLNPVSVAIDPVAVGVFFISKVEKSASKQSWKDASFMKYHRGKWRTLLCLHIFLRRWRTMSLIVRLRSLDGSNWRFCNSVSTKGWAAVRRKEGKKGHLLKSVFTLTAIISVTQTDAVGALLFSQSVWDLSLRRGNLERNAKRLQGRAACHEGLMQPKGKVRICTHLLPMYSFLGGKLGKWLTGVGRGQRSGWAKCP